ALLTLQYTGSAMFQILQSIMAGLLGTPASTDARSMLEEDMRINGPQMLRATSPVLLAVMGAAIIAVGLQVGFHFSTRPLMPNLAKLNPLQGFGRLFAGR